MKSDNQQAGPGLSERITVTRNTLFNAIGRAWEAVLALVLTPYIVHRLGVNTWGIWTLLFAFVGYVTLLDVGVAGSYAKYIAEHYARKEKVAINRIVSTGVFFYFVFGVLLVSVGWICIDQLVHGLARLHPERAGEWADSAVMGNLRFLLRGSILLICLANVFAAFAAVQTGLQRMDVTNIISVAASLVKAGTIVFLVHAGWGIRALLYGEYAGFLAFVIPSIGVSFAILPELRVSPRFVDRATLKRLVDFGWKTQVAKLANLIMFQTDKIVAGIVFRRFGLVGLYDLGIRWANTARQIPALLLSALVPAVSDLDARDQQERLDTLYFRTTKYVGALSMPLGLFLVGNADLIMRVWVGELDGLTTASWVLRIIAIGYIANLIPGAGVSIALGKGRPDLQMKAGLISMIANVFLTVILVFTVGFYGIPLATSMSMFISTLWFFYAFRSFTKVPFRRLFGTAIARPLVSCTPGLLFSLLSAQWVFGESSRVLLAFYLILSAGFFCVTYLMGLRFSTFFDDWDRQFFASFQWASATRLTRLLMGVSPRD